MPSIRIQIPLLLLVLQSSECQTQILAPRNNSGIVAGNVPGCPFGQDGYFSDPSSCTSYVECRSTDQGQTSVRHQCPKSQPYFQPASTVGFGFCSATPATGGTTCQQQDFPQLPGNGGSSVSQNPVTLFPPFTTSQVLFPAVDKKIPYNDVNIKSAVSVLNIVLGYSFQLSCLRRKVVLTCPEARRMA